MPYITKAARKKFDGWIDGLPEMDVRTVKMKHLSKYDVISVERVNIP